MALEAIGGAGAARAATNVTGTGGSGGIGGLGGPNAQPTGAQGGSFTDALKDMVITRPSASKAEASELTTALAAGEDVDPHKISIAAAKAGVELQLATRTISQATTALRTLMQMQI